MPNVTPGSAARQFYEDHERDMADPEYAEQFLDTTDEFTIPTTDKRKSHFWRLGRFSGGWSPTTNGWGLPCGWRLFLLKGRGISIEIGWHKR